VGRWDANGDGVAWPYEWTAAGGIQTLGSSPGSADAISLDGSTIVGTAADYIWRYTTIGKQVSVPLGALTGTTVVSVSGNGSIIAGNSDQGPWTYDLTNGVRLVPTVLSGLGATTGSCPLSIVGMSSDGGVLAGNGACLSNASGPWIARIH
jgi:hypothetical protein